VPHFSEASQGKLLTCTPNIRAVCYEVIKSYDFTVIYGHRGELAQNHAFDMGYSKVRYPNSKHNKWPSQGIDIAPWPINWNDKESFYYLAGRMMQAADSLGISLRWGGDWDMDQDLHDQNFFDLGHFEDMSPEGFVITT
jgi:peptidoglycan L-alanyl-D-glutamate endopeptidase CwlK